MSTQRKETTTRKIWGGTNR